MYHNTVIHGVFIDNLSAPFPIRSRRTFSWQMDVSLPGGALKKSGLFE
jgi:hypothetical protein